MSFIGDGVTDGWMIAPEDENAIVVGQALLEKFETRIGRKLILMSQDADREIASRAFKIRAFTGPAGGYGKAVCVCQQIICPENAEYRKRRFRDFHCVDDHEQIGPVAETIRALLKIPA
ncbi:MAG: hypothetical protein R2860_08825 [Desulfobacterales bacterium]